MKPLDAARLTRIGKQIRADVLTTHGRDSCIYTSALTLRVLRELGADAFALSVQTVVMNAAAAGFIDEHGGQWRPEDEDAMLAAGGYAVGVGFAAGDMTGKWAGHLAVVCNRRWLLDFSIDQASRPEHDIAIEGLVATVGEPFLRGREAARLIGEGGVRVEYRARPGDRSYRDSPDWERGLAREIEVRS